MGKFTGGRDWRQIYSIYGSDDFHTVAFLLFHSFLFVLISLLILIYFDQVLHFLEITFSNFSVHAIRFSLGFVGSFAALSAACLFFAAGNVLYSSLSLRWETAQRMMSAVSDWSAVRTALDVGCGRGILLNAVAIQLKKEGSSGRVVGLDRRRETAVAVLRRAAAEGVEEYVTVREGDSRMLPFGDGYFDVVVSAAVGEEKGREVGEMVRVLRPGGVGVVWDLVGGKEVVRVLREMRMEDIRVSERITAYMVSSRIVSFRKPVVMAVAEPVDWRANIC